MEELTDTDEPLEVMAEILQAKHKYGQWLIAQWQCPKCEHRFVFHSGSHVKAIAENAVKVLDMLNQPQGITEPCPKCEVVHHVTQCQVKVANRKERRMLEKRNSDRFDGPLKMGGKVTLT